MKVILTGTLQRFADYKREHIVDGDTLGDGLNALMVAQPRLAKVLMDENGEVRQAHVLFLNGEQIGRDELGKAAGDPDSLEIITAIAGG